MPKTTKIENIKMLIKLSNRVLKLKNLPLLQKEKIANFLIKKFQQKLGAKTGRRKPRRATIKIFDESIPRAKYTKEEENILEKKAYLPEDKKIAEATKPAPYDTNPAIMSMIKSNNENKANVQKELRGMETKVSEAKVETSTKLLEQQRKSHEDLMAKERERALERQRDSEQRLLETREQAEQRQRMIEQYALEARERDKERAEQRERDMDRFMMEAREMRRGIEYQRPLQIGFNIAPQKMIEDIDETIEHHESELEKINEQKEQKLKEIEEEAEGEDEEKKEQLTTELEQLEEKKNIIEAEIEVNKEEKEKAKTARGKGKAVVEFEKEVEHINSKIDKDIRKDGTASQFYEKYFNPVFAKYQKIVADRGVKRMPTTKQVDNFRLNYKKLWDIDDDEIPESKQDEYDKLLAVPNRLGEKGIQNIPDWNSKIIVFLRHMKQVKEEQQRIEEERKKAEEEEEERRRAEEEEADEKKEEERRQGREEKQKRRQAKEEREREKEEKREKESAPPSPSTAFTPTYEVPSPPASSPASASSASSHSSSSSSMSAPALSLPAHEFKTGEGETSGAKTETKAKSKDKEKDKHKSSSSSAPKASPKKPKGKGKPYVPYPKPKVNGGMALPRLSEDRPKDINNLISKYGDWDVVAINVGRKPLNGLLEKMANLVTLGKFNKKKAELGIKNYYHLYLVLTIEKEGEQQNIVIEKKNIVLEKNHRVGWKDNYPQTTSGKEQWLNIGLTRPIQLEQFIINGENYNKSSGGDNKMYVYDAVDSNCQVYVKDMLSGNGLWNDYIKKFVMQDVGASVPSLLRRFMKGTTDLAHRIDYMVKGGKKRKKRVVRKRKIK